MADNTDRSDNGGYAEAVFLLIDGAYQPDRAGQGYVVAAQHVHRGEHRRGAGDGRWLGAASGRGALRRL